jgi:ATP-dependent DNA ligase
MFKPMLAGKAPSDLYKLKFPLLVSPKLDGVRVVVIDGVVMSRNLKPIPNGRVQRRFGRKRFSGLDGELIVGSPMDHNCFRNTTSGVMAKGGEPDVQFHIFDRFSKPELPYKFRMELNSFDSVFEACDDFLLVPHYEVGEVQELLSWENAFLRNGYEGLMIRSLHGTYKFGRSTTREGGLLKLKRFDDSEAVIHDVEELMHNDNELTEDALGRAKRQSLKENLRPAGMLGALCVQDVHTGIKFSVGTGFNDNERRQLWATRKSIIGKVIKYRFFPTGSKDKPRFPTYLGFRDSIDF